MRVTFSNQPITLPYLVPTWILLIACPPFRKMSAVNAMKTRKPEKGKTKIKGGMKLCFSFFGCDSRCQRFKPRSTSFFVLCLRVRSTHVRTHNHIKAHVLLFPLRDSLLSFAFLNNLASKTWRCTKDGLISSLLLVGVVLVLSSQQKQNFLFGCETKRWTKKKTVEGI